MGFLERPVLVAGATLALGVAVGAALVAPLIGLDIASVMVGVVLGLAIASVYFVLRVLEPLERGLKLLDSGQLPEKSPLRGRCPRLLAEAEAGRVQG